MPKPSQQIPQIKGALKFYRVMAYVTGTFLLLLVVEMVLKYGFHTEVEAFGDRGVFAFVPENTVTAVNLSTGILIVHGWGYVAYLFSNFNLWRLLRWKFLDFLMMALGGVVPFLSFIVEHFFSRRAKREIVALESERDAKLAASSASTANTSTEGA